MVRDGSVTVWGHWVMTTRSSALRAIPLFTDLPEDELGRLEAAIRPRRTPDGTAILDHQDPSTAVYLVLEGAIRVSLHSRSGREVTYRTMRAPTYFGELAAIDGLPRSAGITAVGETAVATLTADQFRALLRRPEVSMRLIEALAARVRDLTERVFEVSTLPVRYRILSELVRMAEEAGVRDGRVEIRPAPTHMQIATRVSTHREAVTRELRALARDGLLEQRGRSLTIADVEALREQLDDVAGPG